MSITISIIERDKREGLLVSSKIVELYLNINTNSYILVSSNVVMCDEEDE